MHERYLFLPIFLDGTVVATQGSACFVMSVPVSFRAGGVFCPSAGGTIYVECGTTAQGTATLTSTSGGSAYSGTVATGWGTAINCPKDGTIIVYGSAGTVAGTASQLSGYALFAIGEG